MEVLMSILSMVLSGGVLGTLLFYKQKQRKEKAEAASLEIKTQSMANDEYKEVTAVLRELITDLRTNLDNVSAQLTQSRAECSTLYAENTRLKVDAEVNKVRICEKRNCSGRIPESGF